MAKNSLWHTAMYGAEVSPVERVKEDICWKLKKHPVRRFIKERPAGCLSSGNQPMMKGLISSIMSSQ